MTSTMAESAAVDTPPPGVLRRLLGDKVGAATLILLLLIVVVSLLATYLAAADPERVDLDAVLLGPGGAHPLGTDSAGRDTWSRLVHGGRGTLQAALLAAMVSMLIGVPSGLLAGYYGGIVGWIGDWISSMLLALPAIVVLLATRAAFGPSVSVSMIVFGVLLSVGFFRVVRASTEHVAAQLYIDAAKVNGLSDARILRRHVLSVVRAPVIIQASTVIGVAIAVQAGLDFLGLGDPSRPSWGTMLNEGFRNIYLTQWLVLWPALAIATTVGCFVLFANALRDAVEDRGTHGSDVRRAEVVTGTDGGSTSIERSGPALLGPDRPAAPDDLVVRGLSIGYPLSDGTTAEVVSDVSFELPAGETLALVGESGSGKTQTAFAILDLLPPQARRLGGSISLGSTDLTGGMASAGRADVPVRYGLDLAYVPQEPMSSLDPSFTIGHQLIRPLRKVTGASRADAAGQARELLYRVGIKEPERVMRCYPHEISGGMAQRVLIAGAVSCKPRLLVADEPTTALDVTVQAEVLDLLRDLQRDLGMSLLLITHNFGVVADLCDRVVVMKSGRVVESGSTAGVLAQPGHPYTSLLLGSMLQGRVPLSPIAAERSA